MVKKDAPDVARYADMLAAIGTEPRLRIMRLLLSAHPEGLVVGDIQVELGLAPATLSHHLEKLRNEDRVRVQREGTYLRYTANVEALRDVLSFLLAECCGRNRVIPLDTITRMCKC
jgi:ArsR family transcriptional regulator